MHFISLGFVLSALLSGIVCKYDPTWESLDKRPIPLWYDDAKFGIFMHWGVYSALGFEAWFWYWWKQEPQAEIVKFVRDNYPPDITYADFAQDFRAELFDPKQFAELVAASGARYYVLVSKHHEGYTLWPSNYSWNWNSVDIGPNKDLVGELAQAFRQYAPGVKFGVYHSMFEFFNPLYLKDKNNKFQTQEFTAFKAVPELHELVENYHPEVIWSDGAWEASSAYWNASAFLAWLYNDSPVRDTIVVNDRWGSDTDCKHGDFFNCQDQYNPGVLQKHKWENAMIVDSQSWGFRRNMKINEIRSINQLITILAETISCGGNLLMNVGPTGDGRIDAVFQERLIQMGTWLRINGDAVYSSKPWIFQNDTITPGIWYTSKLRNSAELDPRRLFNPQQKDNTIVYAFVLSWPQNGKLRLGAPRPTEQTKASMLGLEGTLRYQPIGPKGMTIDLTSIPFAKMPSYDAWVVKLEYLGDDSRNPLTD